MRCSLLVILVLWASLLTCSWASANVGVNDSGNLKSPDSSSSDKTSTNIIISGKNNGNDGHTEASAKGSDADSDRSGPAADPVKATLTGNNSSSGLNATAGDSEGVMHYIKDKNGAIMRAFIVVVGVTALVIIYFVVRAVRLRKKSSKSRKYGIRAKSGDVEMTPLDQDDDDEEMTVFEAANHSRK